MELSAKNVAMVVGLVVTLAAGAISCTGAQGEQGPAGPDGIASRENVYCSYTHDATWAETDSDHGGGYGLRARCEAPEDVPLTGGCSFGTPNGLEHEYELAWDAPSEWDRRGMAMIEARWECNWDETIIHDPNVPVLDGTRAFICCVKPGDGGS